MEGSAEARAPFSPAADEARVPVSPAAPGAAPAEGSCANCGAAVPGAYCSACGQKLHLHRSIGDAVHEMLHGILHFDGKVWTTLPLLATRPGFLTRDYIAGRRARYVSPFALFLLTIFLTFLVFSFGGPSVQGDGIEIDGMSLTTGAARADLARAQADLDAEIARARSDPARAAEVARLEQLRAGLGAVGKSAVRADGSLGVGPDNVSEFIREAHADGTARITFFGIESIEKKANAALANPDLVFYKMKQKGYKLSFLLVPLSLPWLWLLFINRREYHGYDHVVFLLYSISFMSILVLIATLLSMAGITAGWVFAGLLFFYPLVHMFLQLKGAYALSTGGALWRTAFLAAAAAVTLSLYAAIILLLGLID